MSVSRSLAAFRGRLYALLERSFGIDARALATFRISLGLILIADLLLRARNLRRFYTADGVLPVSVLAEQVPLLADLSLHAQSGDAWFQVVLFVIAIMVALAVVIGYRTRLATALSLLLLLSLHARNPYVLNGADSLLEHLLFWSLFLPLGERWAVDARRTDQTRTRIVSVASVAILLQVLLVYGVNAVLKHRSAVWMEGDAVRILFGLDRFTVLLGPTLRRVPILLDVANWAWIVLLTLSPLLVLSSGRLRTALVGAFAGMHFGMLLTMPLGIFPLVSMCALIPFLPPGVWDTLERSSAVGRLRQRATVPGSVLADRLPDWSPPRRVLSQHRRRQVSKTLAAVALVGIVLFNATALGFLPVPAPVENTVAEDQIDSRWTLFAPNPSSTDRWYVAPGTVDTGERIDAFGGSELRWDRPPNIAATYWSARHGKFMRNLRYDGTLQAALGRYLCDRWNRNHEAELVSLELYAVETPSFALEESSTERVQLVNKSCNPDA